MSKVNPAFIKEFKDAKSFNAVACMNCGTCTGLCPIGLNNLPREIFRYVLLGLEDKIEENMETIFTCLLCGKCEENCPADVKITENVRAIRAYLARKHFNL